MIYLDTNTLARTLQLNHPHQQPALDALGLLSKRDGELFAISPQVLTEFYAIATRSTNGLTMTPKQALAKMEDFKRQFTLLSETPAIFPSLESLLAKYLPTNRRVFDTRHVAVMLTHGLSKILTFNDADFSPFSEITPLNPFDLLTLPRQ